MTSPPAAIKRRIGQFSKNGFRGHWEMEEMAKE
jgi:hypothetical protein